METMGKYGYGPCHWCGSETDEQHGSVLLGECDCGAHTIEVCPACRANPPDMCPDCDDDQRAAILAARAQKEKMDSIDAASAACDAASAAIWAVQSKTLGTSDHTVSVAAVQAARAVNLMVRALLFEEKGEESRCIQTTNLHTTAQELRTAAVFDMAAERRQRLLRTAARELRAAAGEIDAGAR